MLPPGCSYDHARVIRLTVSSARRVRWPLVVAATCAETAPHFLPMPTAIAGTTSPPVSFRKYDSPCAGTSPKAPAHISAEEEDRVAEAGRFSPTSSFGIAPPWDSFSLQPRGKRNPSAQRLHRSA